MPQGDAFNLEQLEELKQYLLAFKTGESRPSLTLTLAATSTTWHTHDLHALDPSTRYACIPSSFTSKMRRSIHELCALHGIYHVSFGRNGSDTDPRRMILSRDSTFPDNIEAVKQSKANGWYRVRGFAPHFYTR